MLINKALKIRIYPNKAQSEKIDATFGCCRYIYNEMLSRNQKVYQRRGEHLSYIAMQNLLPAMKKYKPWLQNADSQALKNACRHLDTAYKKFFRHESGFPKYHRKHGTQSYTTTQISSIKVDGKKVRLPCLGWIKAKGLRHLPDNIKICMATVSREPDGKYYVSINYKYEKEIQPVTVRSVLGLDYKSKGLYTDSNGHTPCMPHWFCENQAKLAKMQKQLSRKVGSRKGERKSSGWLKQYAKIVMLHKHITDRRKNYLHTLSKRLVEQYDAIAIEDINMKSLSNKGFGNGKATMDNGYGMFTSMLDYKLRHQGKKLIRIDKWYPSSQLCSCCGYRQQMPLSARTYRCPSCSTVIDRDYNAAINIRSEAIRLIAV